MPIVSKAKLVLPESGAPVIIVVLPIGKPPPMASLRSSFGVGRNFTVKLSAISESLINPATILPADALTLSNWALIFFIFSFRDKLSDLVSVFFAIIIVLPS